MGSFKQIFTPEDLQQLDLALQGALATAKERGLNPAGVKPTLMRRLSHVASTGITDLEVLQSEALKEMNIDRFAI